MTHLESRDVAAYLDCTLAPSDRARVEAHAATCDACRTELIEAAHLVRTQPRVRRWILPAGAVAAAAAVVLLLVSTGRGPGAGDAGAYRERPVTNSVAPSAVAPRGRIVGAPRLVWTAVPRADRYRVTLFDDVGAVVWEAWTTDTTAVIPRGIRLLGGGTYLWKVEAQTGWNRFVASDLVEFTVDTTSR